jgi:hypothetical protein
MFWAWARPDPKHQKQRARISLIFMTTPHDKTPARILAARRIVDRMRTAQYVPWRGMPSRLDEIAQKARIAVLPTEQAGLKPGCLV